MVAPPCTTPYFNILGGDQGVVVEVVVEVAAVVSAAVVHQGVKAYMLPLEIIVLTSPMRTIGVSRKGACRIMSVML